MKAISLVCLSVLTAATVLAQSNAPASAPASQAAASAPAKPLTEVEKIELLIDAVKAQTTAQFVRNGKVYDNMTAIKLMREKWRSKRKHIQTARQFIDIAASNSSSSGRPYMIKFTDGKSMTTAAFLRGELDRIEGRVPASQPKS